MFGTVLVLGLFTILNPSQSRSYVTVRMAQQIDETKDCAFCGLHCSIRVLPGLAVYAAADSIILPLSPVSWHTERTASVAGNSA